MLVGRVPRKLLVATGRTTLLSVLLEKDLDDLNTMSLKQSFCWGYRRQTPLNEWYIRLFEVIQCKSAGDCVPALIS